MEAENKIKDEQINEFPENRIPKERNIESDTPSIETLRLTLKKYGVEVSEPQIELLEKFCELQWDWNKKINLTRHTTYEKFVTRDLVDTLAFSEFLAPNEKVLDVGSGSGVPGILLGILRPDVSVSLVECVGKKAKVLADIIHELQLPIPVYCALGQDILGNWQFHTLTFRAVASMKKLLEWFKPCWLHFDRMLLVKGPKWVEERGEARHYSLLKGLALRKLKEYSIPGTSGEKSLVENVEVSVQNENQTLHEDGTKSVILQICPEEKIGKDSLCVLSPLETSKSRNKFDHNRRKKSRVTEETIEYVEAADFEGLDEDGELIKLEKNTPRNRFAKQNHSLRENGQNLGNQHSSNHGNFGDYSKRKEAGKRHGSGMKKSSGNHGNRQNGDDFAADSFLGFGGRSGGLGSGFGERKRFGGRKKVSRASGKRYLPRETE